MVVKLLMRIVLVALPVLIVMSSINYMVDPALILHDGEYEQQTAQGLLENKNVSHTTNRNERKIQRFLIEGISETPDGITVGSSRVMSIPLITLGVENGFCNGMAGAVMEDIISIIGMYDSKNMLPKNIYIGVDPWLFNENHGDTRYQELIPEYNIFSDKLGLPQIPVTVQSKDWFIKIEQAVSPTYFQASIADIHKRPPSPLITDKNPDADQTSINDSLKTEEEINNVNQSVVNTISSASQYHADNYKELSPKIINQFTVLIDYLQNKGIDVTFIISPWHPLYYEYIARTPNYKMLLETEEFIRIFAAERGIHIIGSLNPNNVGATNADFSDFMHPTWEFMTKMCGN